jgi:serine/threonine protein kinase
MNRMSRMMTPETVDQVHKLDNIPKRDFKEIINPKGLYTNADIRNAADLIEKMLAWVPSERISCAEALNHPFLAESHQPKRR